MEPQRFSVEGMDCPSCATSLESVVSGLPGVEACRVDYGSETLVVEGEPERAALDARARSLGFRLIEGRRPTPAADERGFFRYLLDRKDGRLALIALPLILPGLVLHEILGQEIEWAEMLAVAAALLAGAPVLRRGFLAVVQRRGIDINLLMSIAAVGALLIGAWVEAGMLMVLFTIGEALEGFSAGRAREAIRALSRVAPATANRLRRANQADASAGIGISPAALGEDVIWLQAGERDPGCRNENIEGASLDDALGFERVPVEALEVGDAILVRPGERVPADGRVLEGISAVDEAAITGESLPVAKQDGDKVLAGTVNGEGALELEVTRPASDSTLQRIIQMVEAAESRRAPSQRLVDRFAKVYTPLVVVVAVLAATIPTLVFGQPFLDPPDGGTGWLYRSLTVLVVACPCALVISTPVTLISAIAGGARRGVLFKGGAALEAMSGAKALAFDKTGTLTEGKPVVVGVRSIDCIEDVVRRELELADSATSDASTSEGMTVAAESDAARPSSAGSEEAAAAQVSRKLDMTAVAPIPLDCPACDELVALAGALEARSEHPIARAVLEEAQRRGVSGTYQAAAVESMVGHGVRGSVGPRAVTVASHRFFDDNIEHDSEECAAAAADAELGLATMMVSSDEAGYLGRISVTDTLRPESPAVVERLGRLGLRMAMLTGDHRAAALRVAGQVGLPAEGVSASLLPGEKLEALEQFKAAEGSVAMIGDGINDTPALAASDVGIAVAGATTTAQATEVADVVLAGSGLENLPYAFELSRAAVRAVKVNAGIALGMKLAFLIALVLGYGTMWMAVVADVGASLLVTLLGMRMLRFEGGGRVVVDAGSADAKSGAGQDGDAAASNHSASSDAA